MSQRLCKLEAAEHGRSILDGYDRAADKWSFTFDGPFWKAVDHAHSLGKRGAGTKVAIIDTACDLSIPALRDRVDQIFRPVPRPVPDENTDHGSAVALLIAKVAPECRFDVYAVQRGDGTIEAGDVAYAVCDAEKSDAGIINMSLGTWLKLTDLDERLRHITPEVRDGVLYGPTPQHSKYLLLNEINPDPGCELCKRSSLAAKSGKLVFAAAGNDASEISCPARAENVFASGFQIREERVVLRGPDGGQEVRTTAPVATQSIFVDLPLEEVSGVLGTSFASPLYAGVGALGVTAAEFSSYLAAMPMSQIAIVEHMTIKAEIARLGNDTPRLIPRLQRVSDLYLDSLKRLPHIHSTVEYRHRGKPAGVAIADPAQCFACGFLAYPLYVNFGLFLLEHRFTEDAKGLLEVARAIAPWSDAAAADLGRTLEELGDLKEALDLYNIALTLAPGIQPYLESQKRIQEKLGVS
jgi:tetratricopeptide (TPR) repeat protein